MFGTRDVATRPQKPALENGVSDFSTFDDRFVDSLKRTSVDFIPLVDFMTGGVCRWCRFRYRLTDNAQCELLFAAWAPLPQRGAAAHVLS
jgi:hypothetical protein